MMRARVLPPILLGLLLFGFLLAASAPQRTQHTPAAERPTTSPKAEILGPNRQVGLALTPTRYAADRWATRSAAQPTPSATRIRPVPPTRTPQQSLSRRTMPTLPVHAQVKDIYGYGQLLALSCESRSAADWARHFGFTIHELDFFHKLPRSENPEEGFVGDPNGGWGNIPPGPYGVHAEPVAELLKTYGLQARAVRNMRFTDLRAEIAAGRPVMVWVTGHVEPGKGQLYEVAAGKTVTVARYEHTVIVTGYNEKQVTILDGKKVYQRTVETFLKSWGALENMAIVWDPSAVMHRCAPRTGC